MSPNSLKGRGDGTLVASQIIFAANLGRRVLPAVSPSQDAKTAQRDTAREISVLKKAPVADLNTHKRDFWRNMETARREVNLVGLPSFRASSLVERELLPSVMC